MRSKKLGMRLLGAAEIAIDGTSIVGKLHTKSLALLAYLAVEARAHPREHLSDLFWPDLPQEAARSNLRKTLYRLHEALENDDVPRSMGTMWRNS
jgi:DNA-binding SARP family transcriptional activator